jgi:alpha-glucosidase (family GH31 glycosyl hydrolase)
MDVVLNPTAVTYKIIGGIIDMYVVLGPSPNDVSRQYADIVGLPAMIPYWSLGWHQSRWGYASVGDMKTVVAKYKAAQIPLETLWGDIDYMDNYKCFTFDPVNFPVHELRDLVAELHGSGQKVVFILDPGIKEENGYSVYEEGNRRDLWMRRSDKSVFWGKVWPGKVAFPDWFHPNVSQWWTENIQSWLDQVPLDGLWIDMNEPANFCDGDCSAAPPRPISPSKDPNGVFKALGFDPNYPAYEILNYPDPSTTLNGLWVHTIEMDSIHYGK